MLHHKIQYHSFGINNTQSTKITKTVCVFFCPLHAFISLSSTCTDVINVNGQNGWSNYDSIHEIGSKMSPMRVFSALLFLTCKHVMDISHVKCKLYQKRIMDGKMKTNGKVESWIKWNFIKKNGSFFWLSAIIQLSIEYINHVRVGNHEMVIKKDQIWCNVLF